MNHVTLILALLCLLCSTASAQIKSTVKNQDDKNSTTLVIKDSKEVDDMDLLNTSFELEDYDIGDVIIITTDVENEPSELPRKALEEDPKPEKLALSTKKAKKAKKARKTEAKIGKGLAKNKFAKQRKKPKKKADVVFQPGKKKQKRAKWDRKCYSW